MWDLRFGNCAEAPMETILVAHKFVAVLAVDYRAQYMKAGLWTSSSNRSPDREYFRVGGDGDLPIIPI